MSLGGFGDAAADEVAVLPAMAFFETAGGPGGLADRVAPSTFFGAAGTGAGGAEGAVSAEAGANLFAVGEAGTEGECSCMRCCWCMKNDCVAVDGDWFGGSTRLEMDGEALARFTADDGFGEPWGLLGL